MNDLDKMPGPDLIMERIEKLQVINNDLVRNSEMVNRYLQQLQTRLGQLTGLKYFQYNISQDECLIWDGLPKLLFHGTKVKKQLVTVSLFELPTDMQVHLIHNHIINFLDSMINKLGVAHESTSSQSS